MIEIKFRGKRIDNGEWVYGYYVSNSKHHYIFTGQLDITGLYPTWVRHEVDSSTVGQYTGLKDKNGKEIYKGDILDGSYINLMNGQKVIHFYQVEFCRGNFYAELIGRSPYGDTMLYFQNEKSEVIGNIYDNPELLR